MFQVYVFYDEQNNIIATIPSNDIEEAKQYYKENYEEKYFYVEVME